MDENLSRGYCQLQESPDQRGNQARGHHGHQTAGIPAPIDTRNAVYAGLMVCGAGFLLPYNSFITAVDYYLDKFPDTTVIFDMSLTYICMALVSVIMNNMFVELLPVQARITFGYILSVVTMTFIAILDIWLQVFSLQVAYWVTLLAVATVSVGCTVQQSSFYGYTSMLPPRYTQAVMVGESAAGLIVSIDRLVTKALIPERVSTNMLLFFSLSTVTVLFSCLAFHLTQRLPFARYHVSTCRAAGVSEDQRGLGVSASNPEEVSLVDIMDGNVSRDNYGVLVLHSPTTPPSEYDRDWSAHETAPPASCDVTIKSGESRGQGGCVNRYHVSKSVWHYMLSIGLAYFVTLCLFPGIESEIVSCRLGSWMPVLLISVFNLFDFIGKIIASTSFDWPRGRLVFCTAARALLVPLLMLCAAPRGRPIIGGEFWPLMLSITLGITNGYFGSVPMILAPGRVPDDQKELAGNIMTLSYSMGLTTGSAVAYLLNSCLGPHLERPCHINVTGILLLNQHNISDRLLPYPQIYSP